MKSSLPKGNKSLALDKDGNLQNLADWNPKVAELLALEHGLELNEAHWEILNLLREFHDEYELSPAMRVFVKLVKQKLGKDKGNSIYLLRLFPDSPAKLASRIAGLPRPTNCL